MIVPSMTLQEIRKALVADYEDELCGKFKSITITTKSKWMRSGRKDSVETVLFTSRSKNNWRIIVHCKNGNISTVPYLISYDQTGVTASHFMYGHGSESFMYFHTHFFQRYRERAKIDIEKHIIVSGQH